MQKVKVKGHLVQKLKSRNRRMDATALPSMPMWLVRTSSLSTITMTTAVSSSQAPRLPKVSGRIYDAAFSLHIILHHPISLTQNLPLPMGAMDGHLIHYSISPLDATTPNSIYSVLNEKNFIMLHNLILSSA